MTKVTEVMSVDVPHVDYDDSVLRACEVILAKGYSGAIVFQGNRAVGMLTERSLLRRFVELDRKASEVKVSEVMSPILRIDKNATTVDAARRLLAASLTRLCVFEGGKLMGWVTLTDLARETTNRRRLRELLSGPEPAEVYCPVCKVGMMEKRTDENGRVVSWDCTNCGYSMV